jgi:membrane associated rhomboid family serine protease
MLPIPITYIIIGITVLVSIPAMGNADLKWKLMFNAWQIKHHREWYRFFSHALIHADWMHLIFNMFSFFSFGLYVESAFSSPFLFGGRGPVLFALLYIGGAAMSSVYSYEKHKEDIHYNALGASGAVSAVIFAFALMAPTATIQLFFGIPMKAWIFGFVFLGISWYLGRRNVGNIGHDAHFWGAVYGVVFTLCLKPSLASEFISKITGQEG